MAQTTEFAVVSNKLFPRATLRSRFQRILLTVGLMAKTKASKKGERIGDGRPETFLPTVEWSFHKIPPDEREACLFYECCREALRNEPGDEYRWPPWPDLPKDQRKRHVKSRKGGSGRGSVGDADFWPWLPHSANNLLDRRIHPGSARALVVLEIDWSSPDTQLKSDFAEWLATRRAVRGSLAFKYKGGTNKPGPKQNVNRELVDLALYRTKNAGYTAKEAADLLSPLVKELHPHLNMRTINSQAVYEASQRVGELLRSLGI